MRRRYEHYHFHTQLALLLAGLALLVLLALDVVPRWMYNGALRRTCFPLSYLLIIQFCLKRKAKPGNAARGFEVLPLSETQN
jgi:hypothetical protein